MVNNHKSILRFIKSVRESFPDAPIIYTFGGCFGFFKILKTVFPIAKTYRTKDYKHVVAKIGNRYYDIYGECVDISSKPKYDYEKISKEQEETWETVVSGQRVEYMIKKYNSD